MDLWPHQLRALEESRTMFRNKAKSWCLVAPPGAGKSITASRIAMPAAERGKTTYIYTHRIMLAKQMARVFEGLGADIGVIAASQPDKLNLSAKIQICSIDTVYARMNKLEGMSYPKADIVLVDEYHANTEDKAKSVYKRHEAEGAIRIGITATPVNLGEICHHLINAGTYKEMLECKAHLPCECFGPDRPDLSQLKPMKGGDFSSEDDKRINRVPTIFGRVHEYWKKLNPEALPAVGFAPGVAESKWFVHEFLQKGIPCAHIDSERTVFVDKNSNGVLEFKEYPTDDHTREAIIEGSKDGTYKILWNRFILREAIDCLDDQTEVLTEHGWIGIDNEITTGTRVWTLNLNTGEAELKDIEGKTSRWRRPDEKMVVMKGLYNDIRVTEGHRFHIKYFDPEKGTRGGGSGRYSKNFIVRNARDMVGRDADWCMPISAEFDFPGIDLTDDELRLLGWMVSDGGCNGSPNHKAGYIYQKKQQFQPVIKGILDRLGYKFKIYNRKKGLKTYAFLWRYWKHVGAYYSKKGLASWDNMTRKQFQIFWHAMCQGDGHFYKLDEMEDGPGGNRNPTLCSSDKELVDRLQAMCLVRGYSCNVVSSRSSTSLNPTWYLTKRTKAFRSHRGSDERSMSVEFEDGWKPERVWCLTNENDTLFIRRNGKSCIVGNCPSWFHCITATSMGSVSTYLQSTGRVLRYWPEYSHVVYQDHGGNIDRHGLPNQERNWTLGCTNNSIHQEEVKARQKKKGEDAEPICCPKCCNYRTHGAACPFCGYMHSRSIRMVRELDGKLKRQVGRSIKYKEPKPPVTGDQSKWDTLYWAAKNSKKPKPPTFSQMRYIFHKKYGYYPPSDLKNMPPKDSLSWGKQVKKTNWGELQK